MSCASNKSPDILYDLSVWSAVYLGNVAVPGLLGAAAMQRGGWYGMTLAVVALWAVGAVACVRSARLRVVLVYGGTRVALLQVVPLLQFFAGSFALMAWRSLLGENYGTGLSGVGGFVVTLMTGQPLALVALLIGYIAIWLGWVSVPNVETDDVREGD